MGRQRPLNESKTKVLTISGKRLLTRIDHDLAFDAPGECSTCSMCKAFGPRDRPRTNIYPSCGEIV